MNERQAISVELVTLVERARHEMEKAAGNPGTFTSREMILLVMDGTSPLAPPELKQHGSGAFLVKLVSRRNLVQSYSPLQKIINNTPRCGHLEYLVTTANGGDLRCTVCDLGFKNSKNKVLS